MGNCHSAVSGIGGTARPATKVTILRDLKKAHGAGGHLLDVGCSFGHFMLSALLMGYTGVCGCDLPENQDVQCTVLTNAKARLGISPGDLCEWIGSDVRNLILPEQLSRRITQRRFSSGLVVPDELTERTRLRRRDSMFSGPSEWRPGGDPELCDSGLHIPFTRRLPRPAAAGAGDCPRAPRRRRLSSAPAAAGAGDCPRAPSRRRTLASAPSAPAAAPVLGIGSGNFPRAMSCSCCILK